MSKWWRRLQLITTGITIIPSVILLIFAYMSATRPNHTSAEAIVLLLLAIGFPPLVYGLGSLTIWLKRGQAPDADATSLAARIARKPYLAVVPVLLMLGIVWFLDGFNEGLKRGEDSPDVFTAMRSSCVSEATKSAQQSGANSDASAVKAKVDRYCTCIVLQVQEQYSPAEFEKVTARDPAGLANDKKFAGLIDKCASEAQQP